MESLENRPGCLLVILKLFGIAPSGSAGVSLSYRRRDDFLSAAERSFFGVLQQAVGARGVVFAKVRVADLLYVPRGEGSLAAQNRINAKHVDFVLCEPGTLQPLAAIELDDASHRRSDRVDRDEFLDAAFEAADLRLLRFPVERQYELRQVAETLETALQPKVSKAELPIPSGDSPEGPECPRCRQPMVLRKASTGPRKGRPFYGCSNYPKCRETIPA